MVEELMTESSQSDLGQIGYRIRSEREKKGWSIADVSASLRINEKILKAKLVLVSLLIIVAIISIPIISVPGNVFLKHALEWDYFLGVIAFYLLTFFMWKNKKN